ncbi:MAG TPA: 30S ribosomal protein S2 [Patescibacteria group bacterium]|jgi:small subunit ribosomal protein S2
MIDFDKLPHKAPEFDLTELLEAGMHFGHQAAKWHPKMSDFIYTQKNGVHIFDLAKTAQQLTKAYNYLFDLGSQGKKVIFVSTKRQIRELVREVAGQAGAFFIAQRWMGGLLTNWDQISKSVRRMNEIDEGLESGKFDGYTKFERVKLEKEQGRLARFFEGVKELKSKPDCLVVIDPQREKIAVTEANKVDVPVVALIDSNTNPTPITLPIPGNDDAVNSISLVLKQLTTAYAEGRKAIKTK